MASKLALWITLFSLGLALIGCEVFGEAPPPKTPVNVRIETVLSPTPGITVTPSETPPPTLTPFPFELIDALPVMAGICFESAYDAAGQTFVMRTAEDHIHLYDLAEQSGLCRRPIIRNPFDFVNGRILAGLWTRGTGCTADHQVLDVVRDEAEKIITIQLKFISEGDCPYELVRPFWVGIEDAFEYEVKIEVAR